MFAPVRFSSHDIAVEARAILSHLQDPRPHRSRRRRDGDGPREVCLPGLDQFIARQRHPLFVEGGAPVHEPRIKEECIDDDPDREEEKRKDRQPIAPRRCRCDVDGARFGLAHNSPGRSLGKERALVSRTPAWLRRECHREQFDPESDHGHRSTVRRPSNTQTSISAPSPG